MATIYVSFERMKQEFQRVLLKLGFAPGRAEQLADVFTQNSLDGVASHGWNRFPVLVDQIQQGYMNVDAEPERVATFGAWEQWDARLGPGPLNALFATNRAMELAREYGVGCVGLRNTNHWMRAGTYGRRAAEAGFVFLCWTNATPTMAPHGGREIRLGNNPLVVAVPKVDGPIVLDIAMTQFAFGKLEVFHRSGEQLPVPGGFDAQGQPTCDPTAILEGGRALPIGYWKGSGLALLWDLTATLLSGGRSTYQIAQHDVEYGVSQVFIAFDVSQASSAALVEQTVDQIIRDLHETAPDGEGQEVLYPGERVLRTRRRNLERGIPIDEAAWQQILNM
jgi:3-dehydro-L-gulonate 2-dehydrogenase